jgi:hypothetical protein
MYRMQSLVEAEGGRLLRVLLLRGHAMPVDSRSAGDRFAGVVLLIEAACIAAGARVSGSPVISMTMLGRLS